MGIERDASARVALDREPAQRGDGDVEALGGSRVLRVNRDGVPGSDLGKSALQRISTAGQPRATELRRQPRGDVIEQLVVLRRSWSRRAATCAK